MGFRLGLGLAAKRRTSSAETLYRRPLHLHCTRESTPRLLTAGVRARVRTQVRGRGRAGVRVMVSEGTPRRHSRMSMPPSFGPSTTTAASYL